MPNEAFVNVQSQHVLPSLVEQGLPRLITVTYRTRILYFAVNMSFVKEMISSMYRLLNP